MSHAAAMTQISKTVQSKYLGLNTDQSDSATGQDLTEKINQAYKEMCRLIKLKEAQRSLHQHKNITITEEWYYRTLQAQFPEFRSLSYSGSKDILELETYDAPMYWVYNGQSPFYIGHPHMAYRFKFSPNGVAGMQNVSKEVLLERLSIKRGTHPHNSNGSSSNFNDICTGPDNPFFRELSNRRGIKSISDFKSNISLALRWMRTYNVNDSYSTRTWTLPGWAGEDETSAIGRQVKSTLFNENESPELKQSMSKALMEAYNYLKEPGEYNDIFTLETRLFFKELVSGFPEAPEDRSFFLTGIMNLLSSAAQGGDEITEVRLIKHQLSDNLDTLRERNSVADCLIGSEEADYLNHSFLRIAKYIYALYLFQALYQVFLVLGRRDNSFMLTNRYTALPLLFRDMAEPIVKNRPPAAGYSRMFLHRLLAKQFTPMLESHNAIRCEEVFKDYTQTIDNLFTLLPNAALRDRDKERWMGCLFAEYNAADNNN